MKISELWNKIISYTSTTGSFGEYIQFFSKDSKELSKCDLKLQEILIYYLVSIENKLWANLAKPLGPHNLHKHCISELFNIFLGTVINLLSGLW